MLSLHTYAQDMVSSSILDFSGNYANETGTATAKKLQFEAIDFGNSPKFEIFKQAGIFFLKTPDEELQLDDMPESISELKTLSFSSIDMSSSPNFFKISISKLSGKSRKDSISLKGFTLK